MVEIKANQLKEKKEQFQGVLRTATGSLNRAFNIANDKGLYDTDKAFTSFVHQTMLNLA
jgi:anion-transporting  ArsA/GET3 family ATPase